MIDDEIAVSSRSHETLKETLYMHMFYVNTTSFWRYMPPQMNYRKTWQAPTNPIGTWTPGTLHIDHAPLAFDLSIFDDTLAQFWYYVVVLLGFYKNLEM